MSIDPGAVPIVNIISSHKISLKTTRCLSLLYQGDTPALPVVALRAKAPVASKAITIAEIVKRRIAERGDQWFQYTKLESVVVEVPNKNAIPVESAGGAGGNKAEEDEDDDPFVPLQEKEGDKKRAVPVMTIYISRAKIEALEKMHGEQSGGGNL